MEECTTCTCSGDNSSDEGKSGKRSELKEEEEGEQEGGEGGRNPPPPPPPKDTLLEGATGEEEEEQEADGGCLERQETQHDVEVHPALQQQQPRPFHRMGEAALLDPVSPASSPGAPEKGGEEELYHRREEMATAAAAAAAAGMAAAEVYASSPLSAGVAAPQSPFADIDLAGLAHRVDRLTETLDNHRAFDAGDHEHSFLHGSPQYSSSSRTGAAQALAAESRHPFAQQQREGQEQGQKQEEPGQGQEQYQPESQHSPFRSPQEGRGAYEREGAADMPQPPPSPSRGVATAAAVAAAAAAAATVALESERHLYREQLSGGSADHTGLGDQVFVNNLATPPSRGGSPLSNQRAFTYGGDAVPLFSAGGEGGGAGGGDGDGLGKARTYSRGQSEEEELGELEAIKASVHRLRQQRLAVERLKAKAGQRELAIQQLASAHSKVQELEGCRAQAQHWERRCDRMEAKLRSERTQREAQVTQMRAMASKVEQDNESLREQLRLQYAQSEASRRQQTLEMDALRRALHESKAATDKSWRNVEAKMQQQQREADKLQREKEDLLFRNGELEERASELESVVGKQRLVLQAREQALHDVGAKLRQSDEERAELHRTVAELREVAGKAHEKARSESGQVRAQAQRLKVEVKGLNTELEDVRREAETMRQVCRSKEEHLSRYREEVRGIQLKIQQYQDGLGRRTLTEKRLRESEEEIVRLSVLLEKERRERNEWAKARVDLLAQFCREEHKLENVML